MSKAKQIRTNSGWGLGVWLLYGGFVLFMSGVVLFASFQQFDLVRDNYYQKDMKYQEHIEKIRRVESLLHQPSISYDYSSQTILFAFPDSVTMGIVTGEIELFRPSNSALDQTLPVELDNDNRMVIPADSLAIGVWRVRADFAIDGVTYYFEQMIIVQK